MPHRARAVVLAALAAAASPAAAQVHIGDPIFLTQSQPQSVSVHYMSASAGSDGLLWLAGSSAYDNVDMPLFFNRSGALGFEHTLGAYNPGDRLDFIYDVLTGRTDSFRTTHPVEARQFRWQWDTPDIILVEVEDTRLPRGDADYNDLRFEIRFQAIPAATTGTAFAVLAAFGFRRRR